LNLPSKSAILALMKPEQLKELLAAQPFVPFRVRMSDGTTYDIKHPELALVSQNVLVIGTGLQSPTGIPEMVRVCSAAHITTVEVLKAA
jgi:hypothetical protein